MSQNMDHMDHTGATYAKGKLFILSVISLVTAGMLFSLRGNTLPQMAKYFFEPIDAANSVKMMATVSGWHFLGMASAIFIGSPLCDYLGMRRLLTLAFICHIITTVAVLATPVGQSAATILSIAFFIGGTAHGLVEAVINPLIATIYADDKTHKLNVLHAWWPGGIIIGGLLGYGFDQIGLGWQIKLATILVPTVIYGAMLIGSKFPPTERMAAGISAGEMLKEALNPLFIVLFLCMFLTASSELAPGQWVETALTRLLGFSGILVLVYVSGLMFVMRHFAGSIAHRLSPIGLMWVSCLLATIGLYLLGHASSAVTGLLAATVWGTGVCYMWPTMLGITSERFPKGGAFLLGIMGSAGNLAIYFVLPKLGAIYDTIKNAGAQQLGQTFEQLQTAAANDATMQASLNKILSEASMTSFTWVARLPAILLIVFGAWWLWDRSHGGYKAVKLGKDLDQ